MSLFPSGRRFSFAGVPKISESFLAATFNVRCPCDKTPNSWEERKDRCTALIREVRMDIFGVQEAKDFQLNDLVADGEYLFFGKGRDDHASRGEFSAILYRVSRFELLEGETFGLSERPEEPGLRSWGSGCPRIATWGLFRDKLTGRKFLFVNTHLDNRSELARINGMKVLEKRLRGKRNEHPMILTGDFNAPPFSAPWKIASAFLRDACTVSRTPHTGPVQTFHAYGKKTLDYPIDFLFVSPELEVLTHRTVSSDLPQGYASDHHALIAKMVLK
ncbi:MAG: endonuclease/exonuclease/phosphatase family protein [Lentisphaeria bacterium]|nr:endonuclease/exonuclease/phosphatase family protein [Lentisphaeria bacterium]